ncbi:type II secretion system secretin GspD [Alteromonas sp. D210916BOD_24]|uniref:secretin N-terminal domain-containing protein n=1 Tax=Alteromonas sp. D210916BOD_24 TaxID=3157618 RepID=UPI00399D0078
MKVDRLPSGARTSISPRLQVLSLALVLSLLQSCASFRGPAYKLSQENEDSFNEPLTSPSIKQNEPVSPVGSTDSSSRADKPNIKVSVAPKLVSQEEYEEARELVIPALSSDFVGKQTYSDLPIPAFINEIYGNQLGLNFVINPSIEAASDLVTLRLSQKMSQRDLFILASNTLRQYGVSYYIEDNALIFDYAQSSSFEETPLIMSGVALPEVPPGNRPVFFVYTMTSTQSLSVNGILRELFTGKDLEVTNDPTRNALILKGSSHKVKDAIEVIRLLDRPSLADKQSQIITPSVSKPSELAASLEQVLQAEGFFMQQGGQNSVIKLLPLDAAGQLVVFANSKEVMHYLVEWSEKLEQRRQNEVQNGLFVYRAQNTQAEYIVSLLSNLGMANGVMSSNSERNERQSSSTQSKTSQNSSSDNPLAEGRLAVDEQLNQILFSGSAKSWLNMLEMIKQLDKPSPSVLVEIVLAEVVLSETETSAISWLHSNARNLTGGFSSQFNTSGLQLTFNTADTVNGVLNFLYNNTKTTVRSRPRVMVKSGKEANIEVGRRVPIVSTNVQSTVSSDANIIQSVVYQETGVLLNIKPIVHATGFVEIELSQELSDAQTNTSSGIDSPIISTRKIETTLTLRDGAGVVFGGLISSNNTDGENGVPVISKLPLIGNLFKGDNLTNDRTELMVMIIPYILDNANEVESISDEIRANRKELLEKLEE